MSGHASCFSELKLRQNLHKTAGFACCESGSSMLDGNHISVLSRSRVRGSPETFNKIICLGQSVLLNSQKDGFNVESRLFVAETSSLISGVAQRYAGSLFELALDAKSVAAVEKDLDRFEALLSGSEDLKRLISSPVFNAEDQLHATTRRKLPTRPLMPALSAIAPMA